jgi:hypothetical protein
LDPHKGSSVSERVLARLIQAEAHEPDVWLRDDYRQAFIVVTLAARGDTMPFVVASYQMYGISPNKIWAARIAKRKAQLGEEYSKFYDENGCPILAQHSASLGQSGEVRCLQNDGLPGQIQPSPISPKKSMQSAGGDTSEEVA